MRDGERIAYDAPHALLGREDSEFAVLVRAAGPANAARIAEVAEAAFAIKDGTPCKHMAHQYFLSSLPWA
ncbi:hypothetical protein HKX48_003971 [Thoreauomyces humboldtii]|nr:hypothetical protein HKX48_003971 [Thoreauomyces humboldtii]